MGINKAPFQEGLSIRRFMERCRTGGGRTCMRLGQFHAAKTFRKNLKTAWSGTYPVLNVAKYPHCHFAAVQSRFNRRFDLSAILKRLPVTSVITPPRPERFCGRLTIVANQVACNVEYGAISMGR